MNTFRILIVMYVFIVASLAVAVDDFNRPNTYGTARERRDPGAAKTSRKGAKRGTVRANRRSPPGAARRAPRYAAPALPRDNAQNEARNPASEESLVTDPTLLAPPEDNYGSTEGSN